jgi:hypothetical protein
MSGGTPAPFTVTTSVSELTMPTTPPTPPFHYYLCGDGIVVSEDGEHIVAD